MISGDLLIAVLGKIRGLDRIPGFFWTKGGFGQGLDRNLQGFLSEGAISAGVGQDQGRILSDDRSPLVMPDPIGHLLPQVENRPVPFDDSSNLKDFTIPRVRIFRILGDFGNPSDLKGQKCYSGSERFARFISFCIFV